MNPQQGNAPDFSMQGKAGNSVRKILKDNGGSMSDAINSYEKRRDACFTAMAGIANPKEFMEAVGELEEKLKEKCVEFGHDDDCASLEPDPWNCDCGMGVVDKILGKLTAAREGGARGEV